MAFSPEALKLIESAVEKRGKPFTDLEVRPIAHKLWEEKGQPQQGLEDQLKDWYGAEAILAVRALLGIDSSSNPER